MNLITHSASKLLRLPDANRHQRRALQQSGYLDVADLSVSAYTRLKRNLEDYGNELSDDHQAALMRMVGMFSMLASRKKTGRYAFDLDTGGGKTQACAAWIAEVHHRGLDYSVAVAASKVEDLCEMKRSLIANGVPEHKVGLWHGYQYDPAMIEDVKHGRAPKFATEPATTDHTSKQFLLVTHNRIRGKKDTPAMNTYNGRDRDLLLWDESLIVSEATAINYTDFGAAVDWLKWKMREIPADDTGIRSHCRPAYEYLARCVEVFEAENKAQVAEKRSAVAIDLPELETDALDSYIAGIETYATRYPTDVDPLVKLLNVCQQPMRVTPTEGGAGAVITYDICVPPSLSRIAVLDASWPIRELAQIGGNIKSDPGFNGRIKSYRDVTIHHLRVGSGRGTVEKAFGKSSATDRELSREIVEVVRSIPEDEGIILFVFKPKGYGSKVVDQEQVLRGDLEAAGVNLSTTVLDHRGHSRPRFVFLRWGQETSISEFQYCQNVIFASVLWRSDSDLLASIVGQEDNLLADVAMDKLARIKRKEIAHALYQAMNRGSARSGVNGYARRMNVWLAFPNDYIKQPLMDAMRDLKWLPWVPKFMDALPAVTYEAAEKIADYLTKIADKTKSFSTNFIKKTLGLTEMTKSTFQDARDMALKMTSEWTLPAGSRSLVHVSQLGERMGFEVEADDDEK